jgi:hypothetical protein
MKALSGLISPYLQMLRIPGLDAYRTGGNEYVTGSESKRPRFCHSASPSSRHSNLQGLRSISDILVYQRSFRQAKLSCSVFVSRVIGLSMNRQSQLGWAIGW